VKETNDAFYHQPNASNRTINIADEVRGNDWKFTGNSSSGLRSGRE